MNSITTARRLVVSGMWTTALSTVLCVVHGAHAQQGGQYVVWGQMVQLPESVLPYAQVAGGLHHSVGLRTDGSVAVWGSNIYGQLTPPVSAVGIRQVAAGDDHSVALRVDGVVVAWGRGSTPPPPPDPGNPSQGADSGQSIVPPGLPPVVSVAAGLYHSLAVLVDGTVRVWGYSCEPPPSTSYGFNVPPSSLTSVRSCDGGYRHNAAVRVDGSVACWGTNNYGESDIPPGLPACIEVACGQIHSAALSTDGRVHCWGDNGLGQCAVPLGLQFVTAIATGSAHTAALTADGSVVAWGYNGSGQCTPPVALGACAAITANGMWTGAIELDGTVKGWGDNLENQCEPPPRAGLVQSVDAGSYHIVAARLDGSVAVWGRNEYGVAQVPPTVAQEQIVAVSAGYAHNLALTATGRVLAWGQNVFGQCDIPNPEPLCVAIGAGSTHSLAARSGTSGGVVCWGWNAYGQCTPPALPQVLDVAGGIGHSVALKSDGKVSCWGWNAAGQCNENFTQSPNQPVTDVDAGDYHSVGLRVGVVKCWGGNSYGQCTVPVGLGVVTRVAAGREHTIALKADGRVVAWGRNELGQCAVPASLEHAVAISGGGNASLAIIDNAHSACTNTGGSGQTATLRTSGCRWEEISIWDWSGGIGSNVPGPGSTVDLGAYGSVGSECDAACATLHTHGGSSILVPVDLTVPASGQPDHSIDVSDTANLAGRVWLVGTGASTLPLDLNIPVLRSGNPVAGFDIVQTTVPAPAGYFLALVPSAGVRGTTLYSLRLLPLQSSDGLVGSATGSFSGEAIAAEAMDWNGDGFDDLALAIDFGPAQSGQLQVMLNDGTGNLGLTSLLVATPPVPTCLAVGDLNGDGKSDAVVGTASDQLVHLYYNNSPTMAPAFTVGPVINPNGMPLSVVVMQPPPALQGMGGDVGVGSNGGTTGPTEFSTYSGSTGSGSSDPIVTSTTPTTTTRRGGRLATGGSSSSSVDGVMPVSVGRVSIIEWRQVGTPAVWKLTEIQVMDVPGSPVAIEMADVDGDGLDEIVTANADPQYQGAATTLPVLTMFRGLSGATAFGSAIPIAPNGASVGRDISLIDIDNDGDRDLISVQQTLGTQTTASTIRIDTAGPGGAMTIGAQSAIDAQHPTLCTRGNIDGVGGEDLFLVDDGGASLVGGGVQLARPFLGDPGVIPCPADVSGDGTVNGLDLGIMLGEWGGSGSADVNDDGIVNGNDLGIILGAWGACLAD